MQVRPADVVRDCEVAIAGICELKYGTRPRVEIVGDPDAAIAYVPEHLEYMIGEVLKNSFFATIEQNPNASVIEVSIDPAIHDYTYQSGTDWTTHAALRVRIRDYGGGIPEEHYRVLWNYGFTTFNDAQATDATSSAVDAHAIDVMTGGGSVIGGWGYGLPLSKAYVECFGGSIEVCNNNQNGTDVTITLDGYRG
ncbi:hypothetical protein MRB53_038643 [Persea americana]|nr:hypothetical protein MRB53_038643 [Persea americana]